MAKINGMDVAFIAADVAEKALNAGLSGCIKLSRLGADQAMPWEQIAADLHGYVDAAIQIEKDAEDDRPKDTAPDGWPH